MSTRHVKSASEAKFVSGHVEASPDEPWRFTDHGSLACIKMDPDTIVRVAPMNRQYGGWNDAHFHPALRLADATPADGMVVTLEAMARECVAVALSPSPSFCLGKTIVVHFGAAGNVSTVIRRRLENETEAVDITFVSRVCSERRWVSYWICLSKQGKVYVGTGKTPGTKCIGMLDDSLHFSLRSPEDALMYVGLGNSALGRNARPLKVRNVCITTVPSYLPDILENLPSDMDHVMVEDENDEETKRLLEEYQQECQKNKARALKFGVEYKEPPPGAFLQWNQARKLRANPEKGFITGIDVTAPEELAKQEARKARFAADHDKKRKNVDDEDAPQEKQEEEDDTGMDEEKEPLPVSQAWDNEELVREHRTDPPPSLYVDPPPPEEERETNDFSLNPPAEATLTPEKIHLCSIDWAAFKQIRTEDIMKYFENYGPSYVEWLGELSCNVLFEDKFSASRALHNLSQELPSPPPSEVVWSDRSTLPDFGNMTWRFCNQPIRKIANDRYGRRGTTARILMRVANSRDVLAERPKHKPAPPPGFTTKRVLGPGSENAAVEHRQKRRRRNQQEEEDDAMPFDPSSGAEHPALSRGLQSGRAGFSVEELEAERARKREEASAANQDETS